MQQGPAAVSGVEVDIRVIAQQSLRTEDFQVLCRGICRLVPKAVIAPGVMCSYE